MMARADTPGSTASSKRITAAVTEVDVSPLRHQRLREEARIFRRRAPSFSTPPRANLVGKSSFASSQLDLFVQARLTPYGNRRSGVRIAHSEGLCDLAKELKSDDPLPVRSQIIGFVVHDFRL